jgi:DUF1680 family protein
VPSDLYGYLNDCRREVVLKVNGESFGLDMDRGFARLRRRWKKGDTIELDLPMPVRRLWSHQNVSDNLGRTAVERGPVVYCFEGVDNPRGVADLLVPAEARLQTEYRGDLLGGVVTLKGRGRIREKQPDGGVRFEGVDVLAIPYYAWAHRGKSPMAVWIPACAQIENW